MSEMNREDVKTEWEQPKESPLAEMSQHDMHKLLEYRSELFESVAKEYKALVDAIYRLPIHVIKRQMAFQNIDQGWHWVKDGLDDVWEVPMPCVESEASEAPPESQL